MDAQFHQIVSGRDTRLIARLIRPVLGMVARPYGLAVAARNRMYDAGVLTARRVSVPVVSIGNITLGGTGKTPFVEFVCRWFLDRGKRPVILSRGYRSAGGQNDEAELLRANLPEVPHLQGHDRVQLARRAIETQQPDVLVLDDGFQHRRLARDLDIVLIDCTEPFGYGRVFPRGLLREPIANLSRSDLIVMSRANLCTPKDLIRLRSQIAAAAGEMPFVLAEHRPTTFRSSDGRTWSVGTLANRSVAAFCGIGNPDAFWKTLNRLGCSIAGTRTFPDHHQYSASDLAMLAIWAKELRSEFVVTTQKDLVKIPQHELSGRPLVALHIEVAIRDPVGHVDRALMPILSQHGTARHAA
jgi:tetraacyldisaccharide 4'-kinase